MKKILVILAAAALTLVACNNKKASEQPRESWSLTEIYGDTVAFHPDWTYSSVVYEANIRQFTPEGTFKAFEAQLPRLKDLGVDCIWLMPMYPIGKEGRKDTEESLGSYYAIRDYKDVNPEFGTMEDFDHMLATAHELGFKVILDWVANQTAPDHVWMTTKPAEFYERDAEGNAIWEYDWTDTRSLNYESHLVWEAQDDAMRFWLEKGLDGFRCDAAGDVPAEFWQEILPKMNADYPEAYLLAEAERDNLADCVQTFDANYAWELHHLLNSLSQGSKTLQDLKDYLARDKARFPKEAYRLMFTSNHDENSWAGTEFEREGVFAKACAVLCFTLPQGQPLIYTGQEIGLSRRLKFFDKDSITDWTPNEYTCFYKKLTALKHENPALKAGEKGGELVYLEGMPEGVLGFSREVEGNKVIVLANFGVPGEVEEVELENNSNRATGAEAAVKFLNAEAAPVDVTLVLDGQYTSLFDGNVIPEGTFEIKNFMPGDFIVLTK